MIRAITIGREYGSGGGPIAEILARRLSWKLIDDALIARIAQATEAPPEAVKSHDETVDPWFYRMMKSIWLGGFDGALSRPESEPVDADAIAKLWHRVIVEAAEEGSCIAVGRGGQCLLKSRPDVFHVYVYAPLGERVERLREREPAAGDLYNAAIDRDRRRAAYIRHYFDETWTDPLLYDLMISSSMGLDRAADVILKASGLA